MTPRFIILAGLLAAAPVLMPAPAAYGDTAPIYTGRFSNLAVGGYDPVAYFTLGEPVKGAAEFSTTYKGAEFRFSSQANLDAFLAAPDDYAPQFGGYCAYGVAKDAAVKGDPKNWSIVDGKLYLNLNKKIQKQWDEDRAGYISEADEKWPTVLGGKS